MLSGTVHRRVYTDNDAFLCGWMERLVGRGLMPPGEVVCADVRDLEPADEMHLFAGIGGWPLALRMAGWPEDVPVWSGSCPCQPFSTAGRKKGYADERHLWPFMRALIAERRPPIVFGEQVASPAGRAWLDVVSAELEALDFAVGAADLCAAGVGAPHLRQRLFWVGIANGERREGLRLHLRRRRPRQALPEAAGAGAPRGMDDTSGPWSGCAWVPCLDEEGALRHRPVEPGLEPVAHGVRGRAPKLRGYGNAIVVPLAAEFIRSVMDVLTEA